MLGTIQLPRDFHVAAFVEIQLAKIVEKLSRRTLPVNAIEVPVDIFVIVEVTILKQIETVFANALRALNDQVMFVMKVLLQQREDLRHFARVEEEPWY